MTSTNDWFPSTLQDRAVWFHNFTHEMLEIGPFLGFSHEELEQLRADDDWLVFFAGISAAVDSFKESVDRYCTAMTQTEPAVPLPLFSYEILMPPRLSEPKPGIFHRLESMVERIQSSPRYTPRLGALLGIEQMAIAHGEDSGEMHVDM